MVTKTPENTRVTIKIFIIIYLRDNVEFLTVTESTLHAFSSAFGDT